MRVEPEVSLPRNDSMGDTSPGNGLAEGNASLEARLHAEQRRRQEVEALLAAEQESADTIRRVAVALAGEQNLEALVQRVTDEATRAVGAQFGAFFYNVVAHGGEEYLLYTLSGVSREHFAKFPMPRNTAIFAPTFSGSAVVRLDDVTADPRYGQSAPYHGMPPGHLPVRSYLAVPVSSRSGAVLGGLFFGHATPGVFHERAERLVVALATHAAIALEQARFRSSLERAEQLTARRARHAQLQAAVGIALTRQSSLKAMLQQCSEAVAQHLDAALARVWTLEPDSTVLELMASAGLFRHTGGAHSRIAIGQHKVGQIAEERKPQLSNDLKGDVRISDPEWLEREGIVSFAGYPLQIEENLVGVLALFSKQPLASDTLEVLGVVADALAVAIERKRIEEGQRRAAIERERLIVALARSNRELDHFAYVTSHDLKAPLRGIAALSQFMEEDLGERMTPEAHEQMRLLRGRVQRMEDLIEGILNYSRAGRAGAPAEEVDIHQLLVDVVQLLAPKPDTHVEIDAAVPPLLTERVPLQQVFLNLIGNALKHARRDDARVVVRVVDAGPHYQLSVADNGPGIEPQYHERIWQIFQTLESRDKVEGTGIGLSVVRKIAEARGGRSWVESEAGKGAVFHVTWPKQPKQGE
jgi:signal transduction histidine kinase